MPVRRVIASLVLAAFVFAVGCGDDPEQRMVRPPDLAGVDQSAFTLGDEAAPTVVTLYADPFCVGAGCGVLTPGAVGEIVRRYVRTGQVRMMLRPVPTPGYPQTGVREALAASLQDRLWQYVLTFWANQDVEVDALRIAAKVDGLDVARLEEDAASVRITQALSRVRDRASRARAPVPSLYVDPEGKGPSDVQRVALTSEAAVLRAIGTAVSAAGPP